MLICLKFIQGVFVRTDLPNIDPWLLLSIFIYLAFIRIAIFRCWYTTHWPLAAFIYFHLHSIYEIAIFLCWWCTRYFLIIPYWTLVASIHFHVPGIYQNCHIFLLIYLTLHFVSFYPFHVAFIKIAMYPSWCTCHLILAAIIQSPLPGINHNCCLSLLMYLTKNYADWPFSCTRHWSLVGM